MTTETVHAANPDAAATRCGLPFTVYLRLSPKRSRVTCPACLTAMGGGRVVSGLDAVAATPPPEHKEPAMDTDSVPNTPMAKAILNSVRWSRSW